MSPFLIEGTKFMPVIWLVAVVAAGLAALVIGALSLRTSGAYFIMITLAFGQMFFYFAISWPSYGGEDGLSIYVRNGFPGLNTLVPIQFYGLCLVILMLALGLSVAMLARSLSVSRWNGRTAIGGTGASAWAFSVSAAGSWPCHFRCDHRSGGRAVCRSQPVRQPDDVQLADQRRDHDLCHPRRCGAAFRTGGRGGAVHRAGTCAGRVWRVLACVSGAAAAGCIVLFARGGLIGLIAGAEAGGMTEPVLDRNRYLEKLWRVDGQRRYLDRPDARRNPRADRAERRGQIDPDQADCRGAAARCGRVLFGAKM